jgi:hypothetical protein
VVFDIRTVITMTAAISPTIPRMIHRFRRDGLPGGVLPEYGNVGAGGGGVDGGDAVGGVGVVADCGCIVELPGRRKGVQSLPSQYRSAFESVGSGLQPGGSGGVVIC